MSIRTELIAALVRIVAENTNIIAKPDPFAESINRFFGMESYDRRLAENLDVELTRGVEATKRCLTNRKFKKITSNY